VKITLGEDLVQTPLPDDPALEKLLRAYFPPQLVERYGDRFESHPLRQRIIITCLVNDMVNRGGITFAHRAQDETMAEPEQVARAYMVCREVFDLDGYVAAVEALDNQLTTDTQAQLYLTFRRLLDRAVRWFLQARPDVIDIGAEIARFGPVVSRLAVRLPDLVVGADKVALDAATDDLLGEGVPPELAARTAGLLTQFMLLDIAEIAAATHESPEDVARAAFTLSDRFDVDALLERITRLPRLDRWQALARGSLRYDLYGALRSLTVAVLTSTPPGELGDRISHWEKENSAAVERAMRTLGEIRKLDSADLASVSVALRTLRGVVRADGTEARERASSDADGMTPPLLP
jgi:glutamate dehydrogenase